MNSGSDLNTFLVQDIDKNSIKNSEFSNIFKHNLVDLKRKSIKNSILQKFKTMEYSWHEMYNISKANLRLTKEINLRTKYLHNVSKTTLSVAVCICKNDFTQQVICTDKAKSSQYFMDAKNFLLSKYT